MAGAGTKKCETAAGGTQVTAGRFRVALAAECMVAVRAGAELWVEVSVGGVAMARKKLGAVPYAVEAERAKTAGMAGSADTAKTADTAGAAAAGGTLKASLDAFDTRLKAVEGRPNVELGQSYAGDLPESWDDDCKVTRSAQTCGIWAYEHCGRNGYKAGWYVGHTSNGVNHLVQCAKW